MTHDLCVVQAVVKAFETVGHIAHVNLREKWMPYKQLIGK